MPTIGVGEIVAGTVVTQIEAAGMVAAVMVTEAGTVVASTDTAVAIMAMAVVTDTINKHISYNANRLLFGKPVCVKGVCC
jgi:hypothetical protein